MSINCGKPRKRQNCPEGTTYDDANIVHPGHRKSQITFEYVLKELLSLIHM